MTSAAGGRRIARGPGDQATFRPFRPVTGKAAVHLPKINWFIVFLFIAVAAALVWPDPGRTGGFCSGNG